MRLGLGLGLGTRARAGVVAPPAPTGITLSSDEVEEGAEVGTVVGQLFMIGGVHPPDTFALTENPDDLFAIEQDTDDNWLLVVAASLTGKGPEVSIKVKVTDGVGAEMIGTLPITISADTDGIPDGDFDDDDIEEGGDFEDSVVVGNTTDGQRFTGRTAGFATFIADAGPPVAEGDYRLRYSADFSGLSQDGRRAMVGVGFKAENDFHLVGYRGNGADPVSIRDSRASGSFDAPNTLTLTDDGEALHAVKEGPNWLRVVISADGETYTTYTADGEIAEPEEGDWTAVYEGQVPVPLNEATDALQFGPAALFAQQDQGVFQINILEWQVDLPAVDGEFVHTDNKTTPITSGATTGTHTFTSVDIGPATDDRELVVLVSMGRDGGSVPEAASVIVGGVSLDRRRSTGSTADTPRARSAMFQGPVPSGDVPSNTADIIVGWSANRPDDHITIFVYSGNGPYHVDALAASASIGGSVNSPTGGETFALATRGVAEDTSITGVAMQAQNFNPNVNHRVSAAYESLDVAGTLEISTVASSTLVTMALRPGEGNLNIALVTVDTGHAAAINTRDSLELFGHDVTLVADADVGTHNFAPYDVVLLVRNTTVGIASDMRSLLDGGKPLVIQGIEGVDIPAAMDLSGNWAGGSGNTDLIITDNTHPVTDGLSEGTVAIMTDTGFRYWLDASEPFVGDALADAAASDDRPAVIAIEQGTQDLENETVNARVVLIGASNEPRTALGRTVLGRMVMWAAGRIGVTP